MAKPLIHDKLITFRLSTADLRRMDSLVQPLGARDRSDLLRKMIARAGSDIQPRAQT